MGDAPTDKVTWLARRCAESGLRLDQARNLFDALWLADVLAANGGSVSRAAEATGMGRAQFYRMARRTDDEGEARDA